MEKIIIPISDNLKKELNKIGIDNISLLSIIKECEKHKDYIKSSKIVSYFTLYNENNLLVYLEDYGDQVFLFCVTCHI